MRRRLDDLFARGGVTGRFDGTLFVCRTPSAIIYNIAPIAEGEVIATERGTDVAVRVTISPGYGGRGALTRPPKRED